MTLEERVLELEEKLKSIVSEKFKNSYTGVGGRNLYSLDQIVDFCKFHSHYNIQKDVECLFDKTIQIENYINDELKPKKLKNSYYWIHTKSKNRWYGKLKFWKWNIFKRKEKINKTIKTNNISEIDAGWDGLKLDKSFCYTCNDLGYENCGSLGWIICDSCHNLKNKQFNDYFR